MLEVIDLFATQTRLYEAERLSFRMLKIPPIQKQLLSIYKIDKVEDIKLTNELRLVNGWFSDNDRNIDIDQMIIDPRRIIVKVSGPTYIADKLQQSLLTFIDRNDMRFVEKDNVLSGPLLITNESAVLFAHEADFLSLLGGSSLAHVESSWVDEIQAEAPIHIEPAVIAWRVRFNPIPDDLHEMRVNLADKQMYIEYRGKRQDGKTLYYLSAPVDTDTVQRLANQVDEWLTM